MRVVFTGYIRTPGFASPGEWLFRLRAYTGVLDALAKHHEVISIEQVGYETDYVQNGVRYLFRDYGKDLLRLPFRLHRLIRKLQPDVVIVHGSSFPLQEIQLRMTLGKHAAIFVQDHSPHPPAGLRAWLRKLADPFVNGYFFSSKALAAPWLAQRLIRDVSRVHEIKVGSSVFEPCDFAKARRHTGMQGEPAFLLIGRMDENKDPMTVITAFLRFAVDRPLAKLYIIGAEGPESATVKNFLAAHDPEGSVVIIGTVPHSDMGYWYSAANFLVAASHREVFGASVVEAMSCGCTPILTSIPSFQKIIGHGACGWSFDPGDTNALLRCMQQASSTKQQAARQATMAVFHERLSFAVIAEAICQAVVSIPRIRRKAPAESVMA